MWSNHAASFAHYGNLHGTLAGAGLIKIDEIKAPERSSRSNAPSIKAMFNERRPCHCAFQSARQPPFSIRGGHYDLHARRSQRFPNLLAGPAVGHNGVHRRRIRIGDQAVFAKLAVICQHIAPVRTLYHLAIQAGQAQMIA